MNKRRTTHGMWGTSIYNIWKGMKKRCFNKNYKYYKDYGGRGIIPSISWMEFKNFYEDMGNNPEGMTLDRIDNNDGYHKENCRWADVFTQQNNRRSNHVIEFNGEELTITQWSKKTGINKVTLRKRIEAGWKVEKALTKKVR